MMKPIPALAVALALACVPASAQQQPVNVGGSPNDGTGDSLRVALGKLNANDASLFGSVGTLGASLAAKQPLSPNLTALSAGTITGVGTGPNTLAAGNDPRLAGALQAVNNLSEISVAGPAAQATARTSLALGSLSVQGAGSVAITGGAINGTVIGGATPAAGTFTTATATSFVGALTGNAQTASTLATPRTLALSSDVTGSATFDGSANATIAATIATGAVTNAKLAQAPAGTLKGNTGTSAGAVSDYTPSAVLDAAFGSTRGNVLYRGASGWAALPPGATGQYLGTGGAGADPSWGTPSGAGNVTTSGSPSAGQFALFTSGTAIKGVAAPSFRNRIIDGAFTINQRAVASVSTAYAAGAYTYDRWKAGSAGVTVSFGTAGSGDGTASITAGTLAQVIEGALYLPEGGTYVASWSGTATCRFYQGTATGSYVASPLAISGLTAGTNGTLECSTGTLTQVQVEPGSQATAFERRDDELRRAQRYYETGIFAIVGTATAAGQYFGDTVSFKVTKRAAPTVVPTNTLNSNGGAPVANPVTVDRTRIYVQSAGSGNLEDNGTYTALSEL